MSKAILDKLSLKGLTLAPSQVWGQIRLVPLLREEVREDLRLAQVEFNEYLTVVNQDLPFIHRPDQEGLSAV